MDILEPLKREMQEVHQRLSAAQQRLAVAQGEFNAAQQKLVHAQGEFQVASQLFNAYNVVVTSKANNVQTANTNGASPTNPPTTQVPNRVLPARVIVNPQVIPHRPVEIAAPRPAPNQAPQVVASPDEAKPETNKTQAVRDLLREHPTGMTPAEIWKELKDQFSTRAYLYAVLKRLRDRGDAKERRNKYSLVVKPSEENEVIVQ